MGPKLAPSGMGVDLREINSQKFSTQLLRARADNPIVPSAALPQEIAMKTTTNWPKHWTKEQVEHAEALCRENPSYRDSFVRPIKASDMPDPEITKWGRAGMNH